MKRLVGIDLGTSSSMVKAKEYQDGKAPDAASLDCKAVVFTQQKMGSTPTLIRERGENRWYGYDAEQNPIKDSTLHQNFKIDLRNGDPQTRARAVTLIEDFFSFLYRSYAEQRRFLFDLSTDAYGDEETMVSYPPQWDGDQREIVLGAARKAGFRNVKGMDEATASVHCILNAKKEELAGKGLLRAGKPLNAVIVDMGAGTADLAFVRITLNNGLMTEILGTWPPAESKHIFGGSQMDELLAERMAKWLAASGLGPDMAKNVVKGQSSAIKRWKELTVSPLLASGQRVDDCAAVSGMCSYLGLDLKPFPALDRESFARDYQAYLETFVSLLNSAPKALRDETQLVILTGGNSQWYWIDEVLMGANTRFGKAELPQIAGHPELLLRMELPTETVARGLVYSRLPLEIRDEPEQPKPVLPTEPAHFPAKPVDQHRLEMPVEPNELENLKFEQAVALSQYVRRHIAGDSSQQVLVTRSGRMQTTKLSFLQKIGKWQIDVSRFQDVRDICWGSNKELFFAFRTRGGKLVGSTEACDFSKVLSSIDEDIVNNSFSYDHYLYSDSFIAVLQDGTVFAKCASSEIGNNLQKLVEGLTDIGDAILLRSKGVLCLTRTGRLLPLLLDPNHEEDEKKRLGYDFLGEVDVVDGRTLYGHDIEAIRAGCDLFGFPNLRIIALKKGGRVLCCGNICDNIKKSVATWQNIVSVDIGGRDCCYGLQADGDLLFASEKGVRIICGHCIGFVTSDHTTVLAITRDGRLHCIKVVDGSVTDSTIGNWNLFE